MMSSLIRPQQRLTRKPSHLRALASLLVVASVSACGGLTAADPTLNRYGAVSIVGHGSSATSATANATVIFFDAFSAAVPNSALQQGDQCAFAAVDTGTTVTTGIKKVGNSVGLAIGSTNLTLPFEDGLFRYANLVQSPFSYTAGDLAVATIPGAAETYPSSTISVKLAEPIVPAVPTIPAAGAVMTVTWNASNDSTAAVILSLRYANPSNTSYGNEQVYCTLKDDGRFDIPSNGLAAFLAAPNNTRSLRLTRWRTREALLDSRTILHIATSVDSTVKFP